MTRDPRYDILFEPVRIGPHVARNRFFQVPHCNGMGYRDASALAAMRGMKAEGGWAVVCTEMVEIHHTRRCLALCRTPPVERPRHSHAGAHRRQDPRAFLAGRNRALPFGLHRQQSLVARSADRASAPCRRRSYCNDPIQARGMDKQDIRDLRRAHRAAALRSKQAGFDLVYVYAGHGLGIFQHFLSRATNFRNDEYGGSLENRARLLARSDRGHQGRGGRYLRRSRPHRHA